MVSRQALAKKIPAALRRVPGASLRELAVALGAHPSSVAVAVRELVDAGQVHVVRVANRHAYFLPNRAPEDALAFRVRPLLKELLREIQSAGEIRQAQLVAAMAERGWSQSTTKHRLLQLERADLVTRQPGREARYAAKLRPRPRT